MAEEKKVTYRLQKQELSSQKEEKNKSKAKNVLVIGLCVLCAITGFALGLLGRNNETLTVQSPESESIGESKLDLIKSYMESVWLYKNDYEDLSTVLDNKAYYGISSFDEDPYTSYMSEEEIAEFSSSINQNFVGIGVSYVQDGNMATIIHVLKDSPAESAGVQEGDIIISVDGVSVDGKTSSEIKEMVVGEEGTPVLLGVKREGVDLEIEIIRGQIDSTVYAYTQDDYVVLEISSFGDNSYNECIKYLDDLTSYSKIIVDLRNNSGGYQTAVEDIAGLFLPKGTVMMRQVFADGDERSYKTSSNTVYTNFEKVIVLINEDTASAAEVLAIALQEMHSDATVVGRASYGKGVVQTSYALKDGSYLKLTTSKWLSPNGVWVNGEGVQPDVEVDLDEALKVSFIDFANEDDVYEVDNVSEYVRLMQLALRFLDYEPERVDGYFSSQVSEVLKQYQEDKNLDTTGQLDRETYQALVSGVIRAWAFDESKDAQMQKAIELLK